jgi:hypothetical protein
LRDSLFQAVKSEDWRARLTRRHTLEEDLPPFDLHATTLAAAIEPFLVDRAVSV